jgi:CubicO group peptidase (beta-lactamase class C family)
VRELLAGWVACGDAPSVVALVARRGTVVLHEAFGVRHHEDTTPTLRRDSIFPIASSSKPITAAAVMCLVDDGLIGLNRAFIDYVPELDRPEVEGLAEATVRDLLTHTSGIDGNLLNDFILEAEKKAPAPPPQVPGRHPSIGRLIHLAAGAPLANRPGAVMSYADFNYVLLGDIVRQVSGQPLWQFARSRLFEPLGMHDSQYVLPPALRERRVYRAPDAPAAQAFGPWLGGLNSRSPAKRAAVTGMAWSSSAQGVGTGLTARSPRNRRSDMAGTVAATSGRTPSGTWSGCTSSRRPGCIGGGLPQIPICSRMPCTPRSSTECRSYLLARQALACGC